jgi:hypothetical protein
MFTNKKPFQAAYDLVFGLTLGGAAVDIVNSRLMESHPSDENAVQRGVGLAVPAAVEPVVGGLAAGGRDGAGTG